MKTIKIVLYFLFFAVFTVTCAHIQARVDHHVHPKNSIEPAFRPALNSFLNEAKQYGVEVSSEDLTIHFVNDLGKYINGECWYPTKMNGPSILIKRGVWADLDADEQEVLLFHELGHCLLHRDHIVELYSPVPSIREYQIPVSIMYPYTIDGNVYRRNRKHYLDELFDKSHLNDAD